MATTKITWTRIDTLDGAGVYRSSILGQRTWGGTDVYMQVWRHEPGVWGFDLEDANGRSLPSYTTYETRHKAQKAALAWWAANLRWVSERVRHMGETSLFLAHSGAPEALKAIPAVQVPEALVEPKVGQTSTWATKYRTASQRLLELRDAETDDLVRSALGDAACKYILAALEHEEIAFRAARPSTPTAA